MTGEIFWDYQLPISALPLSCVRVDVIHLFCGYFLLLWHWFSKGNYMICVCVWVDVCVCVGFYVTVGRPDDRRESWFPKRPRASEQNLTTYPSLCQAALSTSCPFSNKHLLSPSVFMFMSACPPHHVIHESHHFSHQALWGWAHELVFLGSVPPL